MVAIRIKCPVCGAVLGVRQMPQNMDKVVTCPNCQVANKFRDFKRFEPKPVDDSTQISADVKGFAGKLVDIATKREYPLQEGVNLVGRMTYKTPPKADIPIETEDRGFSREHFFVKVIKGRDGFYHHYVYNASNANPTFVNDAILEEGDKPGLKSGDTIRSSETVLRFEAGTDKEILL